MSAASTSGVGAGQFNVEVDDLDTSDEFDEAFDGDDTVYKVFAGWRFNPFIGVELDYIDLGGPEDTVENVRVKAEINGFAPYLIGTLPLGPIEGFARVGYYFYDVEINGEESARWTTATRISCMASGVGTDLLRASARAARVRDHRCVRSRRRECDLAVRRLAVLNPLRSACQTLTQRELRRCLAGHSSAALLLLACACASAQELEAESYSDRPAHINFVAAGYVRSDGSVLFDTAVPAAMCRPESIR